MRIRKYSIAWWSNEVIGPVLTVAGVFGIMVYGLYCTLGSPF